jgi:hypothetical protein
MAEEAKGGGAKQFFARHGEKVGLGVAAAALVAYLLIGVVMAKEDPSASRVDGEVQRLNREKGVAHPENSPPKAKEWTGVAIGPWNAVMDAPRGANDFGATLLPGIKEKVTLPPKVVVKGVKIPELLFGNTDVALDSITVGWSVKEFTRQELAAFAKDSDVLKLTGFKVEREVNGSGKWEVLADKLDLKTLTWKDTKIEPKTKYAYRVSSLVEADKLNRPEAKGMTVSGGQVQTRGIWNLVFTSPSKSGGAARGMVYIKIEKFEKGVGKIEKPRIHYAGDKIGWWPEKDGEEPTSRHRVTVPGGRSIEVDLNTGATLSAVEPKKVEVPYRKCNPKFQDGAKTGCDQVTLKRTVDTYEIVWSDEEGEKKAYVPAPNVQDQLCEEHGGKKPVVNLPGPGQPEQPKEDPAAVAKAKRETEASKLFDDAQKAELAKKKSEAIAIYEKLLKLYADTDFVAKGKKGTIEDRLAFLKQ